MKNARIHEGDLLLIRRQDDVEDGEIAAVLINDLAILKKVYKNNGTLILQSENPDYPPIIYDNKEDCNIRIIGKLKKTVISF
jgi:repressor LexA